MAQGWPGMGVLQCPYLQLSRISAPFHPFHPGEDGGTSHPETWALVSWVPHDTELVHVHVCVWSLGSQACAVTHICWVPARPAQGTWGSLANRVCQSAWLPRDVGAPWVALLSVLVGPWWT